MSEPSKIRDPQKTRDPQKDILAQIHRESHAQNLEFDQKRVTPTELAKENHNFLGDCVFYHMDSQRRRNEVEGSYIIVYTRPLKSSTGQIGDTQTKVYQGASTTRYVRVDLRNPRNENPESVEEWGRASVCVEKQRVALYFGEVLSRNNARIAIKCTANVAPGNSYPNDLLEEIMHKGLNTPRAEVSFGMKSTSSGLGRQGVYYLGFYFVQIKIPFFNPQTGKEDEQLIIGAKIPHFDPYLKDISNTVLLKQEVWLPSSGDTYSFVDKSEPKRKVRLLVKALAKEGVVGSSKRKEGDVAMGEENSMEGKGKDRDVLVGDENIAMGTKGNDEDVVMGTEEIAMGASEKEGEVEMEVEGGSNGNKGNEPERFAWKTVEAKDETAEK